MSNYKRNKVHSADTHFNRAPMGEIEFSTMHDPFKVETTLNAGDIVPVACWEVLPHSTYEVSAEAAIRQSTMLLPVMDSLVYDLIAVFVPNRVANSAFPNVMGENSTGSWTAPEVDLAPLYRPGLPDVKIPPQSVADYYGFATQGDFPAELLQQCHDLKFRGYLLSFNTLFRDENYQNIIPCSQANIYQGFLEPVGTRISAAYGDDGVGMSNVKGVVSDGSYAYGSAAKEVFGAGTALPATEGFTLPGRVTVWSALDSPLKANKMHDRFTSVLPAPQKGREIVVSSQEYALPLKTISLRTTALDDGYGDPLFQFNGDFFRSKYAIFNSGGDEGSSSIIKHLRVYGNAGGVDEVTESDEPFKVIGTNLGVDSAGLSFSLNDLRLSAAMQQVEEILARSGSRFREYISSFFGLEVENQFADQPVLLGRYRRDLDVYQTAQTSSTDERSPQGNLAAYGYTNKSGYLFQKTFVEHGYVHIFCVIRQKKNIYPAFFDRSNLRRSRLDYYQYPLANISEQPIYAYEINPFYQYTSQVFGYQEAWHEYRQSMDIVTGYLRPGLEDTLAAWTYADDFDIELGFADGEFMKSNASEVVSRTTVSSERNAPQFKAQFVFNVKKEIPLPTYSIPGMDII